MALRRTLRGSLRGGVRIGRGQQPARYLHARSFRFGRADQAGIAVAADLFQLVLIDQQIAAARWHTRCFTPKRPQNGKHRRR